MHIAQLWRYPVKSMAGEQLERTQLGPDGIPGDRLLYVVDEGGQILSARTKPGLLGHRATLSDEGEVLVDGLPWQDPAVAEWVEDAAGVGTRLVAATGSERFDILPLLVATDGAIEAFGYDARRLRPNVVVGGVEGLTERDWEGDALSISESEAIIGLADLRGRCVMTTWDPDTQAQDTNVFRRIGEQFGGTLALNAWTGREGDIAVGDKVQHVPGPLELMAPQMGRYARNR